MIDWNDEIERLTARTAIESIEDSQMQDMIDNGANNNAFDTVEELIVYCKKIIMMASQDSFNEVITQIDRDLGRAAYYS